MTASQNGWAVLTSAQTTAIQLPGGKVTCHPGDVATVFAHLGNRYHNEVQHLVWPGCWGWADRDVRGMTDISNHASGTAIDLNAPLHPLGTSPTANYTAAQIPAIHNIVNFYGGVIRWGGDYVGRKDGMHFEINDGITPAQVATAAAKCNGAVPAPAPAPTLTWENCPTPHDHPWNFQNWYNHYPFSPALLPVISPLSSNFGPQSLDALKKIQARYGLVADGIDGPKTMQLLWSLGWRG